MSSIYKRAKTWHYSRGAGPNRVRVSLNTDNKIRAQRRQRELDDYYEDMVDGRLNVEFNYLVDDFMKTIASRKGAAWNKRVPFHIRHFRQILGGKTVRSISARDINEYIGIRISEDAATKTIKDEIGFLSTIFKYAVGQNMASENPINNPAVVLPRQKQRYPRTIVPHETMVQIFDKGEEMGFFHDVIYWKLLYYTGLRSGDGGGLRKGDITHEGVGSVTQQKTGFKAAIFMHPEVERYGDAIFTLAPDEKKRDRSRRRLKKAAAAVGWKHRIDLHTFRHCFTTRMQETGLSAEDIKILTGHTTSSMVAAYSHPRYDYIKEKIRELD